MKERLQKILSVRGVCSRRKAEEYIQLGLVKVNGAVALLGQKADPEQDTIEVDGTVLEARKELLYYLMHKPVGVVTSNVTRRLVTRHTSVGTSFGHAQGKRPATSDESVTVRDLLPKHLQGKVFPVGRLDKETSGLLLLTNDGVLAYRLTHPKFDHEKEYEVEVKRAIPTGALQKLERGVTISGSRTKPARIVSLSPRCFRIALTEGRNRQIRRMCQKVGYHVVSLKRVRIVTLEDEHLAEGSMRALTEAEKRRLLSAVRLDE